MDDFKSFLKLREAAARAYVNGDAAPLADLATRDLPATFMCPGGGAVVGADAVHDRYAGDANAFTPGGETCFEILQWAADDGVGYWTGFQNATVRMQGKPEPIPMKLRVTEIFRREGDDWMLVHRHADMLAEEKPKPAS